MIKYTGENKNKYFLKKDNIRYEFNKNFEYITSDVIDKEDIFTSRHIEKIKIINRNGDIYYVTLKYGGFHGKGTLYYKNRDRYQGEFKNSKIVEKMKIKNSKIKKKKSRSAMKKIQKDLESF